MFIFLPMGWIIMYNSIPSQYYPVNSGQVQAALKAAGLNICSQTDSQWNLTGAQGGQIFVISSDCSAKQQTDAIYVHTQNFDSADNRDSAVKAIQRGIVINGLNAAVYTYGSYVIVVQGQKGGTPITQTVAQVKAQIGK